MNLSPHISRCVGHVIFWRMDERIMKDECKTCLRYAKHNEFHTGDTDHLYNAPHGRCINKIRKPRNDE